MSDLTPLEAAFRAGAVAALRARAARQRLRAADGTCPAGDAFPGIAVRSGEAVIADRLAAEYERLAAEFESEAAPR